MKGKYRTSLEKSYSSRLSESWNKKFYPVKLPSGSINQTNKISIVSQDKNLTFSNTNKNTHYIKEKEIEDEEFQSIKNLWIDLGVNEEFQNQFKNYILNLDEEGRNEIYKEEKKSLNRLRKYLLKLSKEISNRENNLNALKKLDELLDNIFPEQKLSDSINNNIIQIIQLLRLNAVNIIKDIIKIREISNNKPGKFDLEKLNVAYLYNNNYIIKLTKDIEFLKDSNLKNIIDFSNEDFDSFFTNCSKNSNIKKNQGKIIIPIENELMQEIKQAKYYIMQDIFFNNINKEQYDFNTIDNSKKEFYKTKIKILKIRGKSEQRKNQTQYLPNLYDDNQKHNVYENYRTLNPSKNKNTSLNYSDNNTFKTQGNLNQKMNRQKKNNIEFNNGIGISRKDLLKTFKEIGGKNYNENQIKKYSINYIQKRNYINNIQKEKKEEENILMEGGGIMNEEEENILMEGGGIMNEEENSENFEIVSDKDLINYNFEYENSNEYNEDEKQSYEINKENKNNNLNDNNGILINNLIICSFTYFKNEPNLKREKYINLFAIKVLLSEKKNKNKNKIKFNDDNEINSNEVKSKLKNNIKYNIDIQNLDKIKEILNQRNINFNLENLSYDNNKESDLLTFTFKSKIGNLMTFKYNDYLYNKIEGEIKVLLYEKTNSNFYYLNLQNNNYSFFIVELTNDLKDKLINNENNIYQIFNEMYSDMKRDKDNNNNIIYIPSFNMDNHFTSNNLICLEKNFLIKDEYDNEIYFDTIDEFYKIKLNFDQNYDYNSLLEINENEEHIIIQNSFVFGICNEQILNENQIPAIQLFVINQDYWKSI